MSDYAQITDFSTKDALITGDENKLIKGSEVDAELDAITTAIATKYDSDDLASQAIAEAGSSNTTLLTPLRAKQEVTQILSASLGVTKSTLDFQLDITSLPAQVGIDAANDTIAIYDVSQGLHYEATVDDLNMAGTGFVATSRAIISGAGLIGGGDLTADRTLDIGAGTGITVNADDIEVDLAAVDHDSLLNYDANDHIDHSLITITAGQSLTIASGTGVIDANMTIDADPSSTSARGVIQLCTSTEVRANSGSATAIKAVSPSTLADVFAAAYFAGGSGTTFSETEGAVGWSGSNPGTGVYTVTHGYGSANFHVFANIFQASGNQPFTANVVAQSSTVFTVEVRDNTNALTDSFSRLYLMTMNFNF